MSEKKATSFSYVVVSLSSNVDHIGKVVGAWTNRDKAVRQAFETLGAAAVHVFNPSTGELIETIEKG